MPIITFSEVLDDELVLQAQIQGMLDDIEAGYNTTQFQDNDVAPATVRPRHLTQPTRFTLHRRFQYPANMVSAGAEASPGDWFYPIQDSIIGIDVPHDALNNANEEDMPVFNVRAKFHQVGAYRSQVAPYGLVDRIAIGWTHTGVWNVITKSIRPVENVGGRVEPFFSPLIQAHWYIFGDTWYPPEFYDRGVVCVGSFGGDIKDAPSTGTSTVEVALMVSLNGGSNLIVPPVIDNRFRGQIFCSGRWVSA